MVWYAIHSTSNVLILILLHEHADFLQTVTSNSKLVTSKRGNVHISASVSTFY